MVKTKELLLSVMASNMMAMKVWAGEVFVFFFVQGVSAGNVTTGLPRLSVILTFFLVCAIIE